MKSWRDTPIANSPSIPRFGTLDTSAPPLNWTPMVDAPAPVVIPAASDEWSPEAREAAAKARKRNAAGRPATEPTQREVREANKFNRENTKTKAELLAEHRAEIKADPEKRAWSRENTKKINAYAAKVAKQQREKYGK